MFLLAEIVHNLELIPSIVESCPITLSDILVVPKFSNYNGFHIIGEEMDAAVKLLKASGIGNIPAELIIHGSESMIDMLAKICNKIWQVIKTWT